MHEKSIVEDLISTGDMPEPASLDNVGKRGMRGRGNAAVIIIASVGATRRSRPVAAALQLCISP